MSRSTLTFGFSLDDDRLVTVTQTISSIGAEGPSYGSGGCPAESWVDDEEYEIDGVSVKELPELSDEEEKRYRLAAKGR